MKLAAHIQALGLASFGDYLAFLIPEGPVDGWKASLEYPGFILWSKPGMPSVLATPDSSYDDVAVAWEPREGYEEGLGAFPLPSTQEEYLAGVRGWLKHAEEQEPGLRATAREMREQG